MTGGSRRRDSGNRRRDKENISRDKENISRGRGSGSRSIGGKYISRRRGIERCNKSKNKSRRRKGIYWCVYVRPCFYVCPIILDSISGEV